MNRPAEPSADNLQSDSAVARAIAFGTDITLLIENLRYSPTERLRRGEEFLKSVIAFKEEVQRARQGKTEQL